MEIEKLKLYAGELKLENETIKSEKTVVLPSESSAVSHEKNSDLCFFGENGVTCNLSNESHVSFTRFSFLILTH